MYKPQGILNVVSGYFFIKDPINLVENFKTKKEFKEWLSLGTKEDLYCTLKEFEKSELYEYCAIIRDVLKTL